MRITPDSPREGVRRRDLGEKTRNGVRFDHEEWKNMAANYELLLPLHYRADSVSEQVCTLQLRGSHLAFNRDVCEVVLHQGDSGNFTNSHSRVISQQRSVVLVQMHPNLDFRDVAVFDKV